MINALPRAIVFDWDNTLVDSWGAIIDALNHTRLHYGMRPWSVAECKKNITRSARDSFPEWFPDHWQEAIDIFYGRFNAVQMENFSPLPGAAELLQWLFDRNIPCVVVSNKNGDYLRREAAALGWDKYFRAIVGATDAPRDKPAREHADHALSLAGLVAGRDIWFIGDSEADMQCARNANCFSVLLGVRDMDEDQGQNIVKKWQVNLLLDDCKALLELLKKEK